MKSPIRILWTVNVVLPAVAARFGCAVVPFGGWIPSMIARLAGVPWIRLGVAMRAPVAELQSIEQDGVTYFAVPEARRDRFDVEQRDCDEVLGLFAPHLLHAEGSEMAYTRRFLRTWGGPKLLSLQGVINGYEPYELGRLRIGSMLASLNIRKMLVAIALLAQKQLHFRPRLAKERETIALADHIMGRTPWDQAQAQALNPRATYHTCRRILRPSFEKRRWLRATADEHSIFVGNAGTAKKGAHFAVEAVALLRERFPGIKLRIAGERPPARISSLKSLAGYQSYLAQRIRELGLQENVQFVGVLDGEGMASALERSHVFLLPSIIENSPNTLGEAMMVGVPCVAACVGGVPGMAVDDVEALHYRADDARMLAYQVRRIFEDDSLAERLSIAARQRARITHDPESNLLALLQAYRAIIPRPGDEA